MGTNYYLYSEVCEHCGRGDEPWHIGKSSGGWTFALHVDEEKGIKDLPDLEARWSAPGMLIKDEYGRTIPVDEMRITITERYSRSTISNEQWCRENHAVPGPNNLARRKLERGVIGYGAGTWDLLTGEFS